MSKCDPNKNEICVDGDCVPISDDDEWTIELEIEKGVSMDQFSSADILSSISEVSGVEESGLKIGIEMDADGYITRVFVTVYDDENYDVVVNTVMACSLHNSSSSVDDNS